MNHILDWNYDPVFSIPVYRRVKDFIALDEDTKRGIACVKGLAYTGIHRHLPQPSTYITMLRNPVDRVISHYFHQIRRKARLGETLPRHWDIEAFLADEPFQTSYQLRLLLGTDSDDIESMLHDPLPPDAVQRVKHQLDTLFSIVGVLDYYDESLVLMKHTLDWNRTFYARQNINPLAHAENLIPTDMIAVLRERCAPETAIYHYAKTRLEAQIAQQGDDFQRELTRLRRANRRFEQMRRMTRPIYNTPLWHWLRHTARWLSTRR